MMADTLTIGQKVPARSERDTVGSSKGRIVRGTPAFAALVSYARPNVVFKDEEGTRADRIMAPRLRDRLEILGDLVIHEFPGVKLRVTEAWDENGEHTDGSLHYEGRAADLTTSDLDGAKLGRVARLAVDAGFDWVFFENPRHVHVSVKREDGAGGHALATPAAAEGTKAEAAVAALSPHVRSSSPDALPFAARAYYGFRAEHPAEVRNPLLYFVDYGLDNRTRRGWVFDMNALTVVEGPFTVAHGRGSLKPRDGVPTHFTNLHESGTSSLGLYLTKNTYDFEGHMAGVGLYRSIGLRLDGRSGRFNDQAFTRGVVAHGAPYVTSNDAGRSEGCPAMKQDRAHRLLPRLAEGGVAFLFSPNDADWLAHDPWVHHA
jgi:hypothetical protein